MTTHFGGLTLTKAALARVFAAMEMELVTSTGTRFHMVRGRYVPDDHAYYTRQYLAWPRHVLIERARGVAIATLTRPDFDPSKVTKAYDDLLFLVCIHKLIG